MLDTVCKRTIQTKLGDIYFTPKTGLASIPFKLLV